MTYGEAMVRQQESQRMENGVWVFDKLEPYEPFATSMRHINTMAKNARKRALSISRFSENKRK